MEKNKEKKSKSQIAKKTNTEASPKGYNPLGVGLASYIDQIKFNVDAKVQGPQGFVYIFNSESQKKIEALILKLAPNWQKEILKSSLTREMIHFSGSKGPVWIWNRKQKAGRPSHFGRLEDGDYAWHRDQIAPILSYAKAYQLKSLSVELHRTTTEQELGFLVGLELAAYTFKGVAENQKIDAPVMVLQKVGEKSSEKFDRHLVTEALWRAQSVNWARHFVNTPPNYLNPTTVARWVSQNLKSMPGLSVHIWDHRRLEEEKMGLHLAVGQGSDNPPCMIHLRYRPKSKTDRRLKPIALVGKGVTFDTGGLDIKPSSGMRLMKKDMGGVAALLGLVHWICWSEYKRPVDIYLGLAENSIDAKSFRPSDVVIARNGMKVEIHNTDAEGRLVLADVLDVAVNAKDMDEPAYVINVATLTGAIKAGLGADIAGLFANHDELAEELNQAGAQSGDINWRMPLYNKYTHNFSSQFADIVNATDGFGGAITAALFLEKFVKNKPWAHLDIYAWNDRPTGSLAFSGGNGQPVQCLIQFLKNRESE